MDPSEDVHNVNLEVGPIVLKSCQRNITAACLGACTAWCDVSRRRVHCLVCTQDTGPEGDRVCDKIWQCNSNTCKQAHEKGREDPFMLEMDAVKPVLVHLKSRTCLQGTQAR